MERTDKGALAAKQPQGNSACKSNNAGQRQQGPQQQGAMVRPLCACKGCSRFFFHSCQRRPRKRWRLF